MGGSGQYMNLTKAEQDVKNEFIDNNDGKCVMTRPTMIRQLSRYSTKFFMSKKDSNNKPIFNERKLTRVIDRLENAKIIVHEKTRDGGVVYALSDFVNENPWLLERMREIDLHGQESIGFFFPDYANRQLWAIRLDMTAPEDVKRRGRPSTAMAFKKDQK